MNRALLVLAVLATGCAELYRWPEEQARPRSSRAPAAAPETATNDGHYVVKAGDTLYSIAFRHQLDFRELAVWNDIGPDYLIRPTQVLRLSPPAIEQGSAASSSIRTAPLESPELPQSPAAAPPPVAATPLPAPASAPEPLAPVAGWRWPVVGTVLRAYGSNGSKGLDIAGELGDPVRAAASGRVVYSGSALKGYGELIIIKHNDVHLSAYGYNRRRLVAEGDMVAAGQAIAELGMGPEQRPALHFEIRDKGKPVDPLRVLPPR